MTKGSGELLKKHMKGADITTRELGEMLGWSRHTVIRWRQGHSGIRREQILQMQKILGLTRDEVNELLVSEGYRPLPPELEPALSRPVRPPPLQRPAQTEHFVGREQELERVLQDLQPGRVVTLCGPGGVGKSALAAKVIWMLAKGSSPPPLFPDGVLMCRFSHNRQADLALEHIARTFGEEPRPTPQDAARRALAGRRALLFLDGVEAVDDLQSVLDVCGECGVLMTTRRTDDAITDPQVIMPLSSDEAVELLQAWAGNQADNPKDAREICSLVGRLPLAVRLVGRYLAQRSLSVAAYLEWLRQSPLQALDQAKRQEASIHLLLKQSLAQVGHAARRALAVAGLLAYQSFDAQAVGTALNLSNVETASVLGELANYGLLYHQQDRHQISHVLIQTYVREPAIQFEILYPPISRLLGNQLSRAQQLLLRQGLGRITKKLGVHYTALAERESQGETGGYNRLDVERAHLLHTLEQCVEYKHWEILQTLVLAIHPYLNLRGHWTQRVQVLKHGILAARKLRDRGNEEEFEGNLGYAHRFLGEFSSAIEDFQRALALAQKTGNRSGEAEWLGRMGSVYRNRGNDEDYCEAIRLYKEALALARELGNRELEGRLVGRLGLAYRAVRQVKDAVESHRQALAIAQELGDRLEECTQLGSLGLASRELGRLRESRNFHKQALRIARETAYRREEHCNLGHLGQVYSELGQNGRAISYYQRSLNITREIGDRREEGIRLSCLGFSHFVRCEFDLAEQTYKEALKISESIEDHLGKSYCFLGLGRIYLDRGDIGGACEYLEKSYRLAALETSPWAALALGIARLYQSDREKALGHFEYVIDRCVPLLRREPDLYKFRYARGAALVGRAVSGRCWVDVKERSKLLIPALEEYQRALDTCSARGAAREAIHSLELVQAAGIEGLEPAIDLLERQMTTDEA